MKGCSPRNRARQRQERSMTLRETSAIHTTRTRWALVLGASGCLLLASACGSDTSDDGAGASDTNNGGTGDVAAGATTISDPASILGLSSGIRCSMPPALPRAEVRFETRGGSARLPGHVIIATEDEIAVRVVCSNPDDLSETLGLQLIMSTGSAISARTYTKELPAVTARDAARGGLELEQVRGNCALNHSTEGVVIQTLDEGEPYWDFWYGKYETDRAGSTQVAAGDTTRAQLTWTEAFTVDVTSVELLEDASTPMAIGPNDGIINYEYHGTLSLEMAPTLVDGETPDPTHEPASVSATF
jgi:hypothetical protein